MMNAKRRRRIIEGIIAAAVLAGGAAIYALSRDRAAPAAAVETAVVEKRVVDDIIEVSGNLEPIRAQDLRAPADGVIDEVSSKTGDRLEKGDAIAKMGTAAAEYAADQVRYQIDQEAFSGNKRKLELLKRELAAKEQAVRDLVMRANVSGVVSRLDLKAGDVVTAGTSYGRLIDTSSLVANVEIAETDIPRARPGLAVEFRFPALPGLAAKGRIDSFPAEAKINDRGLVVLPAKLVIDRPPKELLPAYSFSAVIKAGEARELLVVDSRAVSYKAGKPFVERRGKADGPWETVAVETEGFGQGLVRIVSGCAAGDELKLPPKEKTR
jgi:Multidrug resistance efflux pump